MVEDELVQFFMRDYRPTPIVVPWSGDDFFSVDAKPIKLPFKETPRSAQVIAVYQQTNTERLSLYRQTINEIGKTMTRLNIQRVKPPKKEGEKGKAALLKIPGTEFIAEQCKNLLTLNLRAWLPDEILNWIDVAFALDSAGNKPIFNSLLGSGGGSDGNSHFSDNFMKNLWDVLPDFDEQRSSKQKVDGAALLVNSLFDLRCDGLLNGRTSALFDSGAVGGQNATQGMERSSLTNPWNFILGLEGALCMAGTVSKRLNASQSNAAFPFMVVSRAAGNGTFTADNESGQREAWLPLWSRMLGIRELKLMFSEGRAEVRRKPARDGLDFARAISSYGVDRGIASFARFAIVKGRVGGDNYNTAVSLGRFAVQAKPQADLLTEIDDWLAKAQRACSSSKVIPRFRTAFRQIESAIFEFCQHGDSTRFAGILQSLGVFERELSRNHQKLGYVNSEGGFVPPVPLLSQRWIQASNDGTPEWRIAMALSSIHGVPDQLGPLRIHLEPVTLKWQQPDWTEANKAVVWNSSSLPQNMAAVLERRMLEAKRAGVDVVPLFAHRFAQPADVAAFLSSNVDEDRLESLLWGASLINWSKSSATRPKAQPSFVWRDFRLLPRPFVLLKVLFMPELGLRTDKGTSILPDSSILAALRSGDASRACELASWRLRVSGYAPLHDPSLQVKGLDATRLAAALLIPLASPPSTQTNVLSPLAQFVLRQVQLESNE
jgi:CRISPR-associated protein Csx17